MPSVQRAKIFCALESATTVIGLNSILIKDKPIQISKYLAFFGLDGDKSNLPELVS
jgi:hypothetical protein